MDLIRAGLIQPGEVLQFGSRENTQASVTPRGKVLFRGVEYSSLSSAGTAVTNNAVNGWVVWRVKVRENNWIKISDLRDKVKSPTSTADR
jgi:hypothetical protein